MMIRWIGAGACTAGLIVAGVLIGCVPTENGTAGTSVDAALVAGDSTASDNSAPFAHGPIAQNLTEDQLAQLETLHTQLQNGDITHDEFVAQLQEIVGTEFAFGGPMGGPPADLLELSDEQRVAAEDVFGSLHEDIQAIVEASREDIRALLTEEQQATLDEHVASRGDLGMGGRPFGGHGMGGPPIGDIADGPLADVLTDEQIAELESIRTQVESGEITRDEARQQVQDIIGTELAELGGPPFGGHRVHGPGMGGPGFGMMHGGPPADFEQIQQERMDRLTELLDLTEDQQTEIAAIHEETRAAIEARHEQARNDFRALLTDEQLATLDELEAIRPERPW